MNTNITHDDLERYARDMASATNVLVEQVKNASRSVPSSPSYLFDTPSNAARDDPSELHRARQNLLASVKQFQIYLTEPLDFIQQISSKSQILACLRWLGDFQVLACIPLNDSAPLKDVADLIGVSEGQLSRIVRMTATAGFLREPSPGFVAHTALSARFVTQSSFLDAAMFLAETGVPAALQTSVATRLQQGQPGQQSPDTAAATAYATAFNTSQPFYLACEQRKKLQRQWPAFSRCTVDAEEGVMDVIGQLDWLRVGDACVVDVCARSTHTATALAQRFPALQFIVQLSEPTTSVTNNGIESGGEPENSGRRNSRISCQTYAPGFPQTVQDAAVYMFQVPPADPGSLHPADVHIIPTLRAHLSILKSKPAAIFVLLIPVLPHPGAIEPYIEEAARLRDLWKMQLGDGHEMQEEELFAMINSVMDGLGGLVIVDKLKSRSSATVAFKIKYQSFANGQSGSEFRP